MSVASLEMFVHPGPWTIADVEALPETGSRFEILAPGVLTVSPGPATDHQRASRRLANMIEDAARLAGAEVEILENMNVEIPGERLTMPDIVVVDAAVAGTNPVRFQSTDVLLTVEIVSPGSRATDCAIKPELYAEAGIPMYWRLELQPAARFLAFELHRGAYREIADVSAGAGQAIQAGALSIHIDPGELTARPSGGSAARR